MSQNVYFLQVEINHSSDTEMSSEESGVFITARIGDVIERYESPDTFHPENMALNGRVIGDEIWKKLWQNNVFFTHKPTFTEMIRKTKIKSTSKSITPTSKSPRTPSSKLSSAIATNSEPRALGGEIPINSKIIKVEKSRTGRNQMPNWGSVASVPQLAWGLIPSFFMVHSFVWKCSAIWISTDAKAIFNFNYLTFYFVKNIKYIFPSICWQMYYTVYRNGCCSKLGSNWSPKSIFQICY